MKLQILKNIQDCIDGYNPVLIDNGAFNVDLPDNSVESILMIETIDSIGANQIDESLQKIRKLIRLNGSLKISGIDLFCLSRDFLNGTIDTKTYNDIIFSRSGIYDSVTIINKLKALGLSVDQSLIKGSVYEIHAFRRG